MPRATRSRRAELYILGRLAVVALPPVPPPRLFPLRQTSLAKKAEGDRDRGRTEEGKEGRRKSVALMISKKERVKGPL